MYLNHLKEFALHCLPPLNFVGQCNLCQARRVKLSYAVFIFILIYRNEKYMRINYQIYLIILHLKFIFVFITEILVYENNNKLVFLISQFNYRGWFKTIYEKCKYRQRVLRYAYFTLETKGRKHKSRLLQGTGVMAAS